DAELFEKNIAQQRVGVLTGVNNGLITELVQQRNDSAQSDDLRARSEKSGDAHNGIRAHSVHAQRGTSHKAQGVGGLLRAEGSNPLMNIRLATADDPARDFAILLTPER